MESGKTCPNKKLFKCISVQQTQRSLRQTRARKERLILYSGIDILKKLKFYDKIDKELKLSDEIDQQPKKADKAEDDDDEDLITISDSSTESDSESKELCSKPLDSKVSLDVRLDELKPESEQAKSEEAKSSEENILESQIESNANQDSCPIDQKITDRNQEDDSKTTNDQNNLKSNESDDENIPLNKLIDKKKENPNKNETEVENCDVKTETQEWEKNESRNTSDVSLFDEDEENNIDLDDETENNHKYLWCFCDKGSHFLGITVPCDKCYQWYHLVCAGEDSSEESSRNKKDFICFICRNDTELLNKHHDQLMRGRLANKTLEEDESEEQAVQKKPSIKSTSEINQSVTKKRLVNDPSSSQSSSESSDSSSDSASDGSESEDEIKRPSKPRTSSSLLSIDQNKYRKLSSNSSSSEKTAPKEKLTDGERIELLRKKIDSQQNNKTKLISNKIILKRPLSHSTGIKQTPVNLNHKNLIHQISVKEKQRAMLTQANKQAPKPPINPSRSTTQPKPNSVQAPSQPKTTKLIPLGAAQKLTHSTMINYNSKRESHRKFLFDKLNERRLLAGDLSDISIEKIEEIVEKLESEVYKEYGSDEKKYTNKLNNIKLQIYSQKNKTFYRKILTNVLSPEQVAKMSSEEMCDDEILERKKKETEESVKGYIQLSNEIAYQRQMLKYKKNNKGDFIIDDDNLSNLNTFLPKVIDDDILQPKTDDKKSKTDKDTDKVLTVNTNEADVENPIPKLNLLKRATSTTETAVGPAISRAVEEQNHDVDKIVSPSFMNLSPNFLNIEHIHRRFDSRIRIGSDTSASNMISPKDGPSSSGSVSNPLERPSLIKLSDLNTVAQKTKSRGVDSDFESDSDENLQINTNNEKNFSATESLFQPVSPIAQTSKSSSSISILPTYLAKKSLIVSPTVSDNIQTSLSLNKESIQEKTTSDINSKTLSPSSDLGFWSGFIENTEKDRVYVNAKLLTEINEKPPESFLNILNKELFSDIFNELLSYNSYHSEKDIKYMWDNLAVKCTKNNLVVVKFDVDDPESKKSYVSLMSQYKLNDSDMYKRFYQSLDDNLKNFKFAKIDIPAKFSNLIEGFYLIPMREKDKPKEDELLKRRYNISVVRDKNLIYGFIVGHDKEEKTPPSVVSIPQSNDSSNNKRKLPEAQNSEINIATSAIRPSSSQQISIGIRDPRLVNRLNPGVQSDSPLSPPDETSSSDSTSSTAIGPANIDQIPSESPSPKRLKPDASKSEQKTDEQAILETQGILKEDLENETSKDHQFLSASLKGSSKAAFIETLKIHKLNLECKNSIDWSFENSNWTLSKNFFEIKHPDHEYEKTDEKTDTYKRSSSETDYQERNRYCDTNHRTNDDRKDYRDNRSYHHNFNSHKYKNFHRNSDRSNNFNRFR